MSDLSALAFLEFPNNLFINLNNISYLRLNKDKLRIEVILNYPIRNSSILSKDGSLKTVSDYEYIRFTDVKTLNTTWEQTLALVKKYPCCRVLKRKHPTGLNSQDFIINMDNVSTIKIKSHYVAIDFNHSVTYIDKHTGTSNQLAAQFLYIDIVDNADANDLIKALVDFQA